MRRLETLCMAGVLVLLVTGLSVRLLTIPAFTAVVARAVDSPSHSGLAEKLALDLAEQVRAYVVGANEGPLPSVLDGRQGFTENAVSHLDDVRDVMTAAWLATGLLLAVAGTWFVWGIHVRRYDAVAKVLRGGGWSAIVMVPVAALVALGDFDSFFSAFHGLFFDAGTWQFPSGDLLIGLFPEPFWMTAAAALGGLVLVAGALLLSASRAIEVRQRCVFSADDG